MSAAMNNHDAENVERLQRLLSRESNRIDDAVTVLTDLIRMLQSSQDIVEDQIKIIGDISVDSMPTVRRIVSESTSDLVARYDRMNVLLNELSGTQIQLCTNLQNEVCLSCEALCE